MKFKEGKIIDKINLDGKDIVFRFPKKNDCNQLMNAYNRAIKETQFLSMRNPVKLKKEKEWLFDEIKKLKKKENMMIFIEHGGKIIGNCGIHKHNYDAGKYMGEFGIFILKDYWGLGLGKMLATKCIELARRNTKMKILNSNIYEGNKRSLKLHKRLGFKICGRIPKCIIYDNILRDKIILYKVLKR